MGTFLAMGGYARFVWPAYGVTGVVLLALLLHAIWAWRRAQRALKDEGRR
jgi:heme exporter protein D